MDSNDDVVTCNIGCKKEVCCLGRLLFAHYQDWIRHRGHFAGCTIPKRSEEAHPVVDLVLIGRWRRQRISQKKPSTPEVVADPSFDSDRPRQDVASQVHAAIEAQIELLAAKLSHDIRDGSAIISRWIVLGAHRGPREVERHDVVGQSASLQQLARMILCEESDSGAGIHRSKTLKHRRRENYISHVPQLEHQNLFYRYERSCLLPEKER